MWALLSCLSKPLFQTVSTSKFTAGRTHNRLIQFTKTDEAFEKFVKVSCFVACLATSWGAFSSTLKVMIW